MSAVTSRTDSGLWNDLDTEKLQEVGKVCANFDLPATDTCILVNVTTQRLHLIALNKLASSYSISTAKNGVGQREGSRQTPLGLHFVAAKIGNGANPFEIFKARISRGEIAEANLGGDLIVGRILWLQGAQLGFNRGKDVEEHVVDSHDRYIYIHGTNDLANIGQPASAGCVRMVPDDVIALFEKVQERTPVYIYKA